MAIDVDREQLWGSGAAATGDVRRAGARRREVAFVLSTPFPAAVGGAERWVEEAAQALSKRANVTLHYLCDAVHEPPARSLSRSYRCFVPPGREGPRLAFAPGLLRPVLAADVVHIHQYGTLTTHLVAMLRRAYRRPTFVTDHGSNGVAIGARLGLTRLFDGFLDVSEFAASAGPNPRSRVVYGGVDAERFTPGDRSADPFALFVGRLMPHKGIDWLIRSLPEGERLVVAGRVVEEHRAYLATLQEMAAGRNVDFVLDASDAKIASLYASAWVTVLPSVATDMYGRQHRVPELLGLSILESMAAGTPVIASDLASMPEVVRDGHNGLLVAPGNVAGLHQALRTLLSAPAEVDRMGRTARADVVDRFTWDAVADRCLAAYEELSPLRRAR